MINRVLEVGDIDWSRGEGRRWIALVVHCAKKTGFTTELVVRDGSLVVTIDSRFSDVVISRKGGRNGIYTA